MVSEQVLQQAVERLGRFGPKAIILFGSQARGTADDRSDVDLLVIYDFKPGEDRSDVWLAMDRSLWGLKIGRDIVVMTPDEFELNRQMPGNVARYAANEGKVLYAAAA